MEKAEKELANARVDLERIKQVVSINTIEGWSKFTLLEREKATAMYGVPADVTRLENAKLRVDAASARLREIRKLDGANV
jgi:hypothetical protein